MVGLSGRARRRARPKDSATASPAKLPRRDAPPESFAASYFRSVCAEAGLDFDDDTGRPTLRCEPRAFSAALANALENNVDYPRNVDEFVDGFDERCADDDRLRTAFAPNAISTRDGDAPVRHSVARLLVDASPAASKIVELVARRATPFAIDDRGDRVRELLKPFALLAEPSAEPELAAALVELLRLAGPAVRLEIVVALPELLSRLENDELADRLCSLALEERELTPATLDCFAYFKLSPEKSARVRERVLDALATSAPPRLFPSLVEFAFRGDDDVGAIRALRSGFEWPRSADADTSQVLTVAAVRSALVRSKALAADWLKLVASTKRAGDRAPFDFVALSLVRSACRGKRAAVDALLKRLACSGAFTRDLLRRCVDAFEPTIRERFDETVGPIVALLTSRGEPAAKRFAVDWLRLLYEKLPEKRRELIGELTRHEFVEAHAADAVLALSGIAERDVDSLRAFSAQILNLVNAVDESNPRETRRTTDLLCALAFGVDDSSLGDDVLMLVRKQLSSSDSAVKSRGVTGAVSAIERLLGRASTERFDSEASEPSDLNRFPDGAPKEAAALVELALKSASRFPETLGHFYDELSSTLLDSPSVERSFLGWLTQKVSNEFQDGFVIDADDEALRPVDGVVLARRYCFDSETELEEPIALNVANLALNADREVADLRVMPACFRLLQILHRKSERGDLVSIDALLGCGVVMPAVADENSLDEFEPSFFDRILNCYVHCVNWFRELVCAFCSQTNSKFREKALGRLNCLVFVETRLQRYVYNSKPDFTPPVVIFSGTTDSKTVPFMMRQGNAKSSKKSSKSRKKKQTQEVNSSVASVLSHEELSPTKDSSTKSTLKYKLNNMLFRRLDFETVNFFREKLYIEDVSNDAPYEACFKMNLDSALFLLNELNPVMSDIFLPTAAKQIHHFSKQTSNSCTRIRGEDAIIVVLELFPYLCNHIESIAQYIKQCLESYDGVRDALGLFTERVSKAQACLGSIFRMITIVLSWSEFQLPEKKKELAACLKILASRNNTGDEKPLLKDLINKSSIYIFEYKDLCLSASTAANLVQLLHSIVDFSSDKQVNKRLVTLSHHMLSIDWKDSFGETEKGLQFNQHVAIFLDAYFSKPCIDDLKSLLVDLNDQCPELVNKNSVLKTFQCISKANFPLLFRSVCKILYDTTKNNINEGLTDSQHLVLWKNVTVIMKGLTDILKVLEQRTNLATFLKRSIPLLRLFLSQGMPMMDLKLKSDPDSVVDILRTLQCSTRFLHSLYCHSRLKKDTSLITYLPQLKLTLETLVYKVKASLLKNNCSEAFWMGNLKNKNLKGEVIPSQSTTHSDSEDNENQLPEDDNSLSDIELDDDSVDSDMKSVSSVY